MNVLQSVSAVAVAGALVIGLSAGAAEAQGRVRPGGSGVRGGGSYPGLRGSGRPVYPRPYVIELPPEPLSPHSLGILERRFQQARETSPNPNTFAGGRWNPRYEVVNPQPLYRYYPPDIGYGYYGPYYYPYATYPYGSSFGAFPYGGINYPNPPAVIQREIVVVPDRRAEPAPRQAEPRRDDYYLRGDRPAGELLSAVLDDIRKAWLNGDFARLKARFVAGGRVRIYLKGQYRYSVDTAEFLELSKSAMERIDTIAFEWDRPKSVEADRAFVTGTHTFTDTDRTKREVYVSYTLERKDGAWKIVETGSSDAPITRHQD